jgi:hypothetical protein
VILQILRRALRESLFKLLQQEFRSQTEVDGAE